MLKLSVLALTSLLFALLFAAVVLAEEGDAAAEGRNASRAVAALLKQADEHLTLGEPEAAQAKYESLLAKYGKTSARFTIRLHLGRFYDKQNQYDKALEHFARAVADASGRGEQNPDLNERVEALFSTGMCYVKLGQGERCFPSFRQVIELAPGTQFANQAYFEIGEAHWAKSNFTQAIANYTLVGTSLDDGQISANRCELGKALFVRIQDQDFLIADGKPVNVEAVTSEGDKETVVLRPLRPGSDTYVGSIATGLGAPKPGDDVLSGTGASTVTLRYVDEHTTAGQLNVVRESTLHFVADARVAITDGAWRDPISQVIIDEGTGTLNLRVVDFDRDTGDVADQLDVEVVVEKPLPKDELAGGKDEEQEIKYEERGRAKLTLTETLIAKRGDEAPAPGGPVRSGTFLLAQPIATQAKAGEKSGALTVAIGDRITVTYRDDKHLDGDAVAVREARCVVVPGSASNLQVAGTSLDDPNLIVQKELSSADISLHIGEVYRDMGLESHAQRRFDEAVGACSRVSQVKGTYDRALHEKTLYTLWRVYLAKGALDDAARACQTLQNEFPDSDYIADSLLAMAKAAELADQPAQAVQIYQQIAALPKGSVLAPEALYRVGLVYEKQIEHQQDGKVAKDPGMRQQAINAFRKVFSTFPDSSSAGDALKKIGDYYLEDGNWNQAIDFFEQILRDYPDAPFIADVLYNLGVARGLKGDYPNALTAFARLEREYPGFDRMERAQTFRKGIEKKMAGKAAKTEKPDQGAAKDKTGAGGAAP